MLVRGHFQQKIVGMISPKKLTAGFRGSGLSYFKTSTLNLESEAVTSPDDIGTVQGSFKSPPESEKETKFFFFFLIGIHPMQG